VRHGGACGVVEAECTAKAAGASSTVATTAGAVECGASSGDVPITARRRGAGGKSFESARRGLDRPVPLPPFQF
jgi:hypothetical protein